MLPVVIVDEMDRSSFAHHQEHKTVHTASGIAKPILLPAVIVDEMDRSSFAHHQKYKTVHTESGIAKPILLPAAIVDEMERSSISSTIAAGSSIGLTIPDAASTVLYF
jgi:hypothetical protein